jgi:hygromycin-B 7''-O-kinase
MKNEVLLYRRLGQTPDLPVPKIIFDDDSKTLLPPNLLVMSKIIGQVLRPLESSLGDGELRDLYGQMGRVLRNLHKIQMAAFGCLVADGVKDPHASNEAYVLFQFAKKLGEFRSYGGDATPVDRIERKVAEQASLLRGCTIPVLCHGDFHTANIIVAKSADGAWRLSGVVDVENAIAGDPLIDLAKTLAYSGANREGLLDGYGPIDRPDWEKTIDLYRLYHALAYWDWAALIGATPRPWLTKDMERLTQST